MSSLGARLLDRVPDAVLKWLAAVLVVACATLNLALVVHVVRHPLRALSYTCAPGHCERWCPPEAPAYCLIVPAQCVARCEPSDVDCRWCAQTCAAGVHEPGPCAACQLDCHAPRHKLIAPLGPSQ